MNRTQALLAVIGVALLVLAIVFVTTVEKSYNRTQNTLPADTTTSLRVVDSDGTLGTSGSITERVQPATYKLQTSL